MRIRKIIKTAVIGLALISAQLAPPVGSLVKDAKAAQNCSLNAFYGTVTYNGVATDAVTVTLTDLTNAAPALTTTTAGGGLYLIESANLATCAAVGDQIQIAATFNGSTGTAVVPYAAQTTTNVNVAITAVVTPVLTSISLTPATVSVAAGATTQLTATALDQNGAAMNPQPAISWTSSNTALATVSNTGLVTGVAAGGPVTITATSGAITSTATLTITAAVIPVLTSISVTPTTPSIMVGGTVQLVATALDQNGAAMNPQPVLTWASSNAGIASVSATGLVTAVSSGSASITATSGTIIGTSIINVTATPVTPVLTTINLTPLTASIAAAATQQLIAATLDQNGAAFATTLTWSSSNPGIASVSTAGLVTAVAPGTATITASSGAISGTATITVTTAAPTLASISVTPATASIAVAATQQLTASALDTNNVAMNPQPAITFASSNTAVATVNATGLVTAVSAGTATITATSGAVSGSMTITVTAPVVTPVLTTINVTPAAPTIAVAGMVQMVAIALDQNGAAMNPQPAFTWTSGSPAIATIDAAGMVTAVSAGTSMIMATSGAISGMVTLTVSATPVTPVFTSINFTPANASIAVAATQQLTASGLDQNGAAMVPQPAFTYSSNNTAVATVDAAGLVTAVAPGTATITATSGAVTATATITVTATPGTPVFTSIGVTPATASIAVGATQQLTVSALDQNGAAMVPQPAFTYTSGNNTFATVSPTGLITGVAAGTATITVTSGAVSGTMNITVTATPGTPVFTSIGVVPTTGSLVIGANQQLTATALDQSSVAMVPQPAITYTTSNPAVATVSASGLVTAVAAGTATITATSGAITGTYAVTVTAPAAVLTSINVTPGVPASVAGMTLQLTASALDQSSLVMNPQPTITWVSSNPAVATISTTGLVNALTAGTTNITASSGNISKTVVLTIAANQPPIINAIPAQTVNVGSSTAFTVIATDANGTPITYGLGVGAPTGAAINATTGAFSWTPATAGRYLFNVTASDGVNTVLSAATVIAGATTSPMTVAGEAVNLLLAANAFTTASSSPATSTPSILAAEPILIITSNGTISIPQSTVITRLDGQNIDATQLMATSTVGNLSGFGNNIALDQAIKWGLPGLGLSFSQPVSVSIFVGPTKNGQTLNVVRSISGTDTWTSDGIVAPTSCTVSGGYCNFLATKASFYAATHNAPASSGGGGGGGNSGGGGGGGGGSVYIPSNPSSSSSSSNTTQPIIEQPTQPVAQVLGVKLYKDGNLLRSKTTKRIFIITGGYKKYVGSLKELKSYGNRWIYDVDDSELAAYPDTDKLMGGVTYSAKSIFKNGTLLKSSTTKRIYVIVNGKKKYIGSLKELKKYKGKINVVSEQVLGQYPDQK